MPAEEHTVPPPPIPGETAAAKRYREAFLPMFMKLKQPEVHGIWGSWDPDKGPQRDSGSSEWPQYDRALVKPGEGLEVDLGTQLQNAAASVSGPSSNVDPARPMIGSDVIAKAVSRQATRKSL